MRSRLFALVAIILLLGVSAARSESDNGAATDDAIKAAYLYNFALYTEWLATPTDGVHICTVGRDMLGSTLDALAGKMLRGQPIIVQHLANGADLRGCHVLYIGSMAAGLRATIARTVSHLPVLTVGEAVDGEDVRLMIRLVPNGPRIAFEIDQSLARAAGLELSSKLLKLARTVR